MPLVHHLQFLKHYVRRPGVVGAVAPSSRALASALCDPIRQRTRPARILEVGAGTGAITRCLGSLLKDEDTLDICEVEPDFAAVLERDVLSHRDFAVARAEGRARLLVQSVQEITLRDHYDFVVSGLPLTAFALEDVRGVFATFRRCLKPTGVLSYFEYVGLRWGSRLLSVGSKRARVRAVSEFLTEHIRRHQFAKKTVLFNVPPAYARHLRLA